MHKVIHRYKTLQSVKSFIYKVIKIIKFITFGYIGVGRMHMGGGGIYINGEWGGVGGLGSGVGGRGPLAHIRCCGSIVAMRMSL